MFGFHKPKIYRSISGCCICRAKSSSSRFTDSGKYEAYFADCFNLIEEKRAGDICNACVLLVKRFKKLPSGLHRHWGHVVDARANVKLRGKISPKKKDEDEDDDDEDVLPRMKRKRRRICREENKVSPPTAVASNIMPDFLDPSIWHVEKVCCGTIFRGPLNVVLIDTRFYKPCRSQQSHNVGNVAAPSLHHPLLSGSSEEDSSNDSATSPLSNSEQADHCPLQL